LKKDIYANINSGNLLPIFNQVKTFSTSEQIEKYGTRSFSTGWIDDQVDLVCLWTCSIPGRWRFAGVTSRQSSGNSSIM